MELVVITITGEDHPGVTSSITTLLSKFDVDILDIGQAVIHNCLNLGVLINVPAEASVFYKEMERCADELSVSVQFTPVTEKSYDEWVGLHGRARIILTLLCRKIQANHIASVSRIIFSNGLNIDTVMRLSGRIPLEHTDDKTKACVEFSLRGNLEHPERFREELMNASMDLDIDIAVQEDSPFRRNRRLIVFDMDSTLIDTEVIDELALRAGVGEEVKKITSSAMRGEIDFKESLRKRVKAITGLDEAVLEEIARDLPLMEGAKSLFQTLKILGYKTAILSGGFTYFAKALQKKLDIDYVYANELEIKEGKLSGKVIEPIVDAQRKADLVKELAEKENISLQQVIAVGDGANDLAMLGTAGLGIAFHAKPIVRENAKQAITNMGLDSILYLMGIRDIDATLPVTSLR